MSQPNKGRRRTNRKRRINRMAERDRRKSLSFCERQQSRRESREDQIGVQIGGVR